MNSAGRRKYWFERHPKKTLFFLVVLCFIVLDLGLAPYFAERIPNIKNVHYHHDLVANYQGGVAWGPYKYQITTNSLGFKDNRNRIVSKVNDKYRLLFMGDSFTEGVGFAYEDTFVGMIAKGLEGSGYEVLNAGVSSYSPKLYYLKIKYLIEEIGLKVDEIFVYLDLSDITDEIEYESFSPSNSKLWPLFNYLNYTIKRNSLVGNLVIRKIIEIKRELLFRTFYRDSSKNNQASSAEGNVSHSQKNNAPSKPAKYWENQDEYLRDRAAWTHKEAVFKNWGMKGFSLAAENMDKLTELCQKHSIKLSIVVYPWPEELKYHNLNSKNVTLWKKFCQERGLKFLNCYPYFFTGEPPEVIIGKYYLTNDAHFNLAGQRLMAKIWLDNYNPNKLGQVR